MVVAIIAMSAAIAAPAVSEAMANRRAGEASHLVVRIGARARSEAIAYGRAHMLVYNDTSSGGTFGSLALWRGQVDRCTANDWTSIISGVCDPVANPNCRDRLDMDRFEFPTNKVQLRLNGATAAHLCFQPDGELYTSTSGYGGLTPAAIPIGADGVTFTIQRLNGTTPVGVQRNVVFPLGGTPRIVR